VLCQSSGVFIPVTLANENVSPFSKSAGLSYPVEYEPTRSDVLNPFDAKNRVAQFSLPASSPKVTRKQPLSHYEEDMLDSTQVVALRSLPIPLTMNRLCSS
jgi:hypothetical protein